MRLESIETCCGVLWVVSLLQIAGFLPRDPKWSDEVECSHSSIPILIIHGEGDALIPMKRSEDLEQGLRKGHRLLNRISHPGAHMVPSCSQELKQKVQTFLDELWVLSRNLFLPICLSSASTQVWLLGLISMANLILVSVINARQSSNHSDASHSGEMYNFTLTEAQTCCSHYVMWATPEKLFVGVTLCSEGSCPACLEISQQADLCTLGPKWSHDVCYCSQVLERVLDRSYLLLMKTILHFLSLNLTCNIHTLVMLALKKLWCYTLL